MVNAQRLLLLLSLLPLLGCRKSSPKEVAPMATLDDDPQLTAARKAWREEQERFMRSELSPLARVDFVPLAAGLQTVAADAPPFNLPAAALSPYRGQLQLTWAAGRVELRAEPSVALNHQLTSQATLKGGDVLALGRIRLLVTGMPDEPALAVYDPEAPAYKGHQSLRYYPDDPRYVTRGRLALYPQPRLVHVAASRGSDKEQLALGLLFFTLDGRQSSIEAYSEQPGSDRLFLIFKDATNGRPGGSYGAGRYLHAKLEAGGEVRLDFNQAWSPLCAYSAYFHCPLPPKQNWLDYPLPVGEKVYREH